MRRRRARAWAVPAAALLLLLAAKLLSLDALTIAGTDALRAGRAATAQRWLRPLALGNVVEPWRAHLALGDVAFLEDDLVEAHAQFSTGLDLAPDDGSRCVVRLNLVLTALRQGDLAGSSGGDAPARYREATGLVDAASGETCRQAERNDLAAAAERARRALADAETAVLPGGSAAPAEQSPEEVAPLTQDRLDELARTAERGAAERAAQSAREESMDGSTGVGGSTPW